jgi:site-specific recombinase XerD
MAVLMTDPVGSGSELGIIERIRCLLTSRGYASGTVEHYLITLRHFQVWMESHGNQVDDASSAYVLEYLASTSRHGKEKTGLPRHCPNEKAALNHLLSILGKIDNDPTASPIDEGLKAFVEHMESTCGLAPATRLYRLRYTAEFLSYLSERNGSSLTAISPQDVEEWMTKRVQGLKPGSANVVAGSLRSYLQYRKLCGITDGCPSSVVPTVPHWRLTSIPRHLDEARLGKLLGCFDQSAAGLRDLAMLLLMSEMGLRASEVAQLALGDIDWRGATLTVRGLKACRDRILPLAHRSGQSIAAYLKSGRLPTNARALFVRHSVPKGIPLSAELVRCAMRRAYARAGFPKEWTGTHLLRHTAATRMQQGGASLKEVADVLGHRSIDTTIIYTKVDIPALRSVALPWPEAF